MQACVTTFRVRTGTGAQTVTGIVDAEGNPFVPEFLIFHSGSSILDTLYANPTALINAMASDKSWFRNTDYSTGYSGIAAVPQFGTKIVSNAGGSGTHGPFASLEGDAFFGGTIYRTAIVTDVRSGEFDLLFETNLNFLTTDVMVTAFSADLLTQYLPFVGITNIYATDFEAKGLLLANIAFSTGGFFATGGGSPTSRYGWDTPTGGPSAADALINSQGGNARYQRTDTFFVQIDGAPTPTNGQGASNVTRWNADNIVTVGSHAIGGMVLGGDGVLCASGVFTQPNGTGTQTIDLGIAAKWIMFMSVGAEESNSLRTDYASKVYGWGNGPSQASFWFGEAADNAQPLQGACYLSATSILRLASGGPQSAATTFDAVASLTALTVDGFAELDWSATNGEATQIVWFAIGEVITPIPPEEPPEEECQTVHPAGCVIAFAPQTAAGSTGCIDALFDPIPTVATPASGGAGTLIAIPRGQLILRGRALTIDVFEPPVALLGVGSLTLTGLAPTAPLATPVLTPDTGALLLAGLAPTLVVVPPVEILTGVGALVLAGAAPGIASDVLISPGLGALTLGGFAPTAVIPSPGIAFDAARDGGFNGGSGNLTWSHTCTGSNRILIVAGIGTGWASTNFITGVTYDGVALTELVQFSSGFGGQKVHLWYLIAPNTGAHNVVISISSAQDLRFGSVSYTGVLQSSFPNAENHQFNFDPLTASVTTTVDNCWTVVLENNFGGTAVISAPGVERTHSVTDSYWYLFDHNGPVTPAGSTSVTTTRTGAGFVTSHTLVALAPA